MQIEHVYERLPPMNVLVALLVAAQIAILAAVLVWAVKRRRERREHA